MLYLPKKETKLRFWKHLLEHQFLNYLTDKFEEQHKYYEKNVLKYHFTVNSFLIQFKILKTVINTLV